MKRPLVDTHCHIDLYPQPERVISDAETESVYTIAVTNWPSLFDRIETLLSGRKFLRPAIGLHPQYAASKRHELPAMLQSMERTRYVGEVGLDYTSSDRSDRETQRMVFQKVLNRCAQYRDKIVTVHSRRAASDVVRMIGRDFPGKVIMHWFSGSNVELAQAADYGMYFSVNLHMVLSQRGKGLVERMPQDRVLTETDGPFTKVRGVPAFPSGVRETVNRLSALWGVSPEVAQETILRNFKNLLKGTPAK